jgi:hypothetical protein
VVIETPIMMEVAEVAARPGKMLTRKAAAESAAHVSPTESAAHTSATESTTNVSTAEPAAHVSTTEPAAHVSTTEPAAHVTTTATEPATVSSAAPAPRKRVRAQRACESGSCSKNDHGLT